MSGTTEGERSARAERSEATRERLVAAAAELFAERGYAGVAMEEVVARAEVTRGALYHHFRDKRDLFRAVYERTEQELVAVTLAALPQGLGPWEELEAGVRAFLDAGLRPDLQRISLLDGPSVLGWAEWREIGDRHALGVMTAVLAAGMEAGVLRPVPVEPLAHLVMAALAEAALTIAAAADPATVRPGVEDALLALLGGLRA